MSRLVSKEKLLLSLTEQADKHMDMAIQVFQNSKAEQLSKSPMDGGWSAAQCLEHLNSYGRHYLPALTTSLAKVGAAPGNGSFSGSWFGSLCTKMMHPDTGKRKFKAFKNHTPTTNLDALVVVQEFIDQQEHLLQILKDADHGDLDKAKVPLSVSKLIQLKAGDVLQFYIAHHERHIRQAISALQSR